MDQCSKHDIPPAVNGNLTDQQGHDLGVETQGPGARQCSPAGGSARPASPIKKRGGRSPLGSAPALATGLARGSADSPRLVLGTICRPAANTSHTISSTGTTGLLRACLRGPSLSSRTPVDDPTRKPENDPLTFLGASFGACLGSLPAQSRSLAYGRSSGPVRGMSRSGHHRNGASGSLRYASLHSGTQR